MRHALLVCALVGALVPACRTDDRARIAALDGEISDTLAAKPVLADVRTRDELAREAGHRVRLHGVYEIEPLAIKGRVVSLVLVDGTRVIRSYAPIDDEIRLADRKVIATGVVYAGPPPRYKEALAGPHVDVDQLELAPGEKAIEPAPTEIPAPPMASAAPALATRLDRWVQLVGRLDAIDPRGEATLRLSDGAFVRVENVAIAHWSAHVGTIVTVVGRVEVDRAASSFALSLVIRSRAAICPGVVPRCAG